MSIQIIASPPGGGKTKYCIEKIAEIRDKEPLSEIQIIVSERLQKQYWKKRLAEYSQNNNKRKGSIGTGVISFARLAMDILEKNSGSPKLISSHLNSLCLEKAIKSAAAKQELTYFEPIYSKPGLVSVLDKTISELQRNRIIPEQLFDPDLTDNKLRDTAMIYREYLDILSNNNWINAAGLLSAAAEQLKTHKNSLRVLPLLVIDGFDFMTKDQLNLIRELSGCYELILITLPVSLRENRETDLRLSENLRNIRDYLNAGIIDLEKKNTAAVFDSLAGQIMSPVGSNTVFPAFAGELMMIGAPFQASEARMVLKQIKKYILADKIDPGECAVLVPDMAAYVPILRQISKEMGIPMYFAEQRRLSDSPPSAVLMRLLRLYPENFPSELLLPVLRSPFLSGCPDPDDEEEDSYGRDFYFLDKICKGMNIIGTKEEWNSAFDTLKEISKKNETENDEENRYDLPSSEKINRIAASFNQFTGFLTPPEGLHSRKGWTDWLGELLEKLHFIDQLTDQTGKIFLNAFRVILKRMVFSEEKLSLSELNYEGFLSELSREMDSTVLSIQGNPSDRVYVGEITRSAGCRWKVSALMGFSESLYPRASTPPLILTDEVRKKLEMTPKADQSLSLLYALTRSDNILIISRPQKTDKGEEWPPSIYWQSVLNLLSRLDKISGPEKLFSVKDLEKAGILMVPVKTCASADELVFDASLNQNLDMEDLTGETGTEVKTKLDHASAALSRLRNQEEGNFGPSPDPVLRDVLADPEKDAVPFSCSAIELFLNCPFRYFLSKMLKLEPPKLPGTGMDAAQLGSLNHLVMERTFPSGTVYDSVGEALEKAKQVIPGILESAAEEFGFRESALWPFEREKLKQKLLDSIEAMFRDKKIEMNSRWKSLGAEVPFGYPSKGKEHAEALLVQTDHGSMKIRGWIDRLDVRDDGLLRVVDYKTGSTGFTEKELASGSHIQAGVYAAAAVNALRLGTECIGTYWLINGKKAYETAEYNINDESIPDAEFLDCFLAGVSQADYPAVQTFTGCPDYCPAAGWCRRKV